MTIIIVQLNIEVVHSKLFILGPHLSVEEEEEESTLNREECHRLSLADSIDTSLKYLSTFPL